MFRSASHTPAEMGKEQLDSMISGWTATVTGNWTLELPPLEEIEMAPSTGSLVLSIMAGEEPAVPEVMFGVIQGGVLSDQSRISPPTLKMSNENDRSCSQRSLGTTKESPAGWVLICGGSAGGDAAIDTASAASILPQPK